MVSKNLKFRNLTGRPIKLLNGTIIYPESQMARLDFTYGEFNNYITELKSYKIINLPKAESGTILIVNAIIEQAADRDDVVSIAIGHQSIIKGKKFGCLHSVPGFARIIFD